MLAKEWEMLTEDAGLKITGRQETGRGIIWLPTCPGPSVRPDGSLGQGMEYGVHAKLSGVIKTNWTDREFGWRVGIREVTQNITFTAAKGGLL